MDDTGGSGGSAGLARGTAAGSGRRRRAPGAGSASGSPAARTGSKSGTKGRARSSRGASSRGAGKGRARGKGKAHGKRRPASRPEPFQYKWVPPPNARSIWHEPGCRSDLQQQMRILQWRKAENDARMKSVIVNTRSMQEQDMMVGLAADRTAERTRWMQQVIGEELQRPLYFDKAAMLHLEAQAQREAEAAQRQARNHRKLLQTVQTGVLRRDPSLVKAGLVGGGNKSVGRNSIGGGSVGTLSLPDISSLGSTTLGPESRKQLEQLQGIKARLKDSHKLLKTKDDIVGEVTRSANTHLRKYRAGGAPRRTPGPGPRRTPGPGPSRGASAAYSLPPATSGAGAGEAGPATSPGDSPVGIRGGASAMSP